MSRLEKKFTRFAFAFIGLIQLWSIAIPVAWQFRSISYTFGYMLLGLVIILGWLYVRYTRIIFLAFLLLWSFIAWVIVYSYDAIHAHGIVEMSAPALTIQSLTPFLVLGISVFVYRLPAWD